MASSRRGAVAQRADASRDEIIRRAPHRRRQPPQAVGHRQRTLRLPQERREARLQAHGLRGAQRRCRAGHRAGRDDPAGREVRRPPGRRVAAGLPAHPVERDDGLVPAPEGAQRGRAELVGLRSRQTTTATSICSKRCSTRGQRWRHRERRPSSWSRAQILHLIDTAGGRSCRRVNAKPSCCVTGRNSTLPRPRRSWVARKAVSRRTAPGQFMRWRWPLPSKGLTTMNLPSRSSPARLRCACSRALQPASAAALAAARRDASARHHRTAARRPRTGPAARAPAAPGRRRACRHQRLGQRSARLVHALVAAPGIGDTAGGAGAGPGADPAGARARADPRRGRGRRRAARRRPAARRLPRPRFRRVPETDAARDRATQSPWLVACMCALGVAALPALAQDKARAPQAPLPAVWPGRR